MLDFTDFDRRYETAVTRVLNAAVSTFGMTKVAKVIKKKGSTRQRDHVYTRAVIFYMMNVKGGVPLKALERLTGFDHATILHSVRLVQDQIDINDFTMNYHYYLPLSIAVGHIMPEEVYKVKLESLMRRWTRVNLLHLLERYTEKMESKVYRLEDLVKEVEKMGFKVSRNPETVFVSYKTEEHLLPEEIIILRNTYGFMVQTEIE